MDEAEINAITREMLTLLEPVLMRGAWLLDDPYGEVYLSNRACLEMDMYKDLAEMKS